MKVNSKIEVLRSPKHLLNSMRIALWCILLLFIPLECQHIYLAFQTSEPLISWLASMNSEWVYHLVWSLLGMVIIYRALNSMSNRDGSVQAQSNVGNKNLSESSWLNNKHVIAGICALLTLLINLYVAWNLGDHHPVYHDEYSYLFQAKTLLQGRLSNPRFERAPELFDQVHVLNLKEGQFTSRYFPGVGIFILPGVAMGIPHLSHWLAGSLITYLITLAGYELGNFKGAWWSGVLCALLPGYPLFANLLLSHHPTLLGLSWFLYWQLRMMKTPALSFAFAAGIGLSFAMLCRPMTAAGFALPFGLWWFVYIVGLRTKSFLPTRIIQTVGIGLPIVAGMVLMLIYNQATTGSYLETPYQLYTDQYTPSHVYGFYNKSRGEAKIKRAIDSGQPLPVLKNYDNWAEELTQMLALKKALTRLQATGIWTIGIIPLMFMLIVFLQAWRSIEQRTIWVFASIICLHIAHIPYWYEGIFYWHYVLESGVLIALLMGLLSATLIECLKETQVRKVINWWYSAFVITALMSFTSFEPFWSSWLNNAMSQIQYSDQKFSEVERIIKDACKDRLALVVIKPDPADLHTDFVVNHPDLFNKKILRARYLPEKYPLNTLHDLFPEREIWLYDVVLKTMSRK